MRAGVSSATVSRVLNEKITSIPVSEKTKQKVLTIAKEMGYRPNLYAKSLRANRSFLIGVVVWDLADPFNSDVLLGIEQSLEHCGYYVLLITAKASLKRARLCMEKMKNLRTDGILIIGGPRNIGEKEIVELGVGTSTTVLVGTKAESTDVSSVTVDNVFGGFIGAEYLIKIGRKSITYIAGKEKESDMESRLEGAQKAIEQYGVQDSFFIINSGPGEEAGYTTTKQILAVAEFPLAIFGVNDITALGIMRAVKDSKLIIPDDVAVLGFDDLSMANYLEPRLSTIRQPRLEMGKIGAECLLTLIDRKDTGLPEKSFQMVLKASLVLRDTT